ALIDDGVADFAGAGPADAALGGRGVEAVGVADGPDAEQGLVGAAPVGVGEVVAGAVVGAEAGVEQAALLEQLHERPEAAAGPAPRPAPASGPRDFCAAPPAAACHGADLLTWAHRGRNTRARRTRLPRRPGTGVGRVPRTGASRPGHLRCRWAIRR